MAEKAITAPELADIIKESVASGQKVDDIASELLGRFQNISSAEFQSHNCDDKDCAVCNIKNDIEAKGYERGVKAGAELSDKLSKKRSVKIAKEEE